MAEYRWNREDVAADYDAAGPLVHPYYREVQDAILELLPFERDAAAVLVDAGGGSGRLVERFLERYPRGRAVVIDQSEPFLALARRRLARFDGRYRTVPARLQDDWRRELEERPRAIVSMSAVHHLDPDEKQAFYRRCAEVLAAGGVFANGDEVRDRDDGVYLAQQTQWGERMERLIAEGRVGPAIAEACREWRSRNVERFDQPKQSGDDCHEPVDVQLEYLRAAGLQNVRCAWQRDMWSVMAGEKP